MTMKGSKVTSESKRTTVIVQMDTETGAFTFSVERDGMTVNTFNLGKEHIE